MIKPIKKRKLVISKSFERHLKIFNLSYGLIPEIEKGASVIVGSLAKGGKILFCGNGGSAADSQHFAAEFICRYQKDRRSLPAIALTTDTSALTAIGNDYGFEKIFSRQISSLGKKGDVLVAITTSGQSKNIIEAIKQARKQNIKVIVLSGIRGRQLGAVSDIGIFVSSDETARIQEIHEFILHSWCEIVEAELFS